MKAARYYGQGDVRVEEVERPVCGPNDVEVEVAAAGICGTDLHEYTAGPILIPDQVPHPATGQTLPITMGHEFAGTVGKIGKEVDGVTRGSKVAVNPMLPCGDCRYCVSGNENVCAQLGFIGLSGGGGGFAGSVVVPEQNVVEVPEAVPIKHAALTEPFAVGLRAVRSSAMRAGDSVAIIGAGPIGLTIVQAAAVGGGCDIFVSEPQDQRRELAISAGATHVFDPTESDLASEVSTRTDGGVDVVFEVSGVEQGFIDAIDVCKHGGEVTLVALHETPVKFNPTDIVIVDKHIRGTNVYAGGNRSGHDFGIVLNLFERNHFDPELLISDNVPLGQLTRIFEKYEERSPVKIIVEP